MQLIRSCRGDQSIKTQSGNSCSGISQDSDHWPVVDESCTLETWIWSLLHIRKSAKVWNHVGRADHMWIQARIVQFLRSAHPEAAPIDSMPRAFWVEWPKADWPISLAACQDWPMHQEPGVQPFSLPDWPAQSHLHTTAGRDARDRWRGSRVERTAWQLLTRSRMLGRCWRCQLTGRREPMSAATAAAAPASGVSAPDAAARVIATVRPTMVDSEHAWVPAPLSDKPDVKM